MVPIVSCFLNVRIVIAMFNFANVSFRAIWFIAGVMVSGDVVSLLGKENNIGSGGSLSSVAARMCTNQSQWFDK